jgi:hypothetical protein
MLRNQYHEGPFNDDELFGPEELSYHKRTKHPFELSPIKSGDEMSVNYVTEEDGGSSMPTLVAMEDTVDPSHSSCTSEPATTFDMIIERFHAPTVLAPSPPKQKSCFRRVCKCFSSQLN